MQMEGMDGQKEKSREGCYATLLEQGCITCDLPRSYAFYAYLVLPTWYLGREVYMGFHYIRTTLASYIRTTAYHLHFSAETRREWWKPRD